MKRNLIPLLALLLSACDPASPPQPETPRASNQAFDTQIKAMEKARGVEAGVQDAGDAQRKQLEAETQ